LEKTPPLTKQPPKPRPPASVFEIHLGNVAEIDPAVPRTDLLFASDANAEPRPCLVEFDVICLAFRHVEASKGGLCELHRDHTFRRDMRRFGKTRGR
jgi:hypothetical protein